MCFLHICLLHFFFVFLLCLGCQKPRCFPHQVTNLPGKNSTFNDFLRSALSVISLVPRALFITQEIPRRLPKLLLSQAPAEFFTCRVSQKNSALRSPWVWFCSLKSHYLDLKILYVNQQILKTPTSS